MNNTPILEGYGVCLEPISEAHIPALTPIAIEASNWRHMTLRIETPTDVKKLVHDSIRNTETGAIESWVITASGRTAGGSSFLDINPTHRTAEIGFTWLATPWRGSGLNPRVKLLQLTYGFETLSFRRIALKTHHENLHSQNAMLKLGAQYEGTFRNHMIMPDGSTRHTKWYSITAEDWPAIKQQLLNRIAHEPLTPPTV
jgi:RimJ/RimL family protein N-acetyltransferase